MPDRSRDDETLVYSTGDGPMAQRPAIARERTAKSAPTAATSGVRIWIERKGRNGTPVSIIRGLPNDRDRLMDLAGRLKRACGTGGSAKDGEIIIQGDHRERIAALLERDGVRAKLAGG
jgi:translation initiation factor 1